MGGGNLRLSFTGDWRLHMLFKSVYRAAIFMCLLMLPVACQQAYLIPDDEAEENSRGKDELTEERKDSTEVTPEFDINGWDEAINADFTFGAQEQEGGEE